MTAHCHCCCSVSKIFPFLLLRFQAEDGRRRIRETEKAFDDKFLPHLFCLSRSFKVDANDGREEGSGCDGCEGFYEFMKEIFNRNNFMEI